MKITLNMLSDAGIEYSWNTIYIALLYDFIEVSEVKDYAIERISSEDYQYNEYINELAWVTTDKNIAIKLILGGKLVKITNSTKELELEKIRYAILLTLFNQYKNSYQAFLKQIERVYADFGYPEDMSSFIYYMPSTMTTKKTKNDVENTEQNLVLNFSKLLKEINQRIQVRSKSST